ncbi:MAG: hypothetical protein GY699_18335 [Desulfobacteraceae bacterium]|nr:hypothetical protein [Desulfobacteraceae bacterium]
MNERFSKYISAAFIIFICAIQSYAGGLYKNSVNKENVCGKPLIMEFEEIERNENYSVCRIKHVEGAAFASISFEVHCYCEIAKIRNSKYFAPLENSDNKNGTWTTKIAFMDSKDIDFNKLYGKDIEDERITSIDECKYY